MLLTLVQLLLQILRLILASRDPGSSAAQLHAAIGEVKAASTGEEKSNAAKKLHDVVAGL